MLAQAAVTRRRATPVRILNDAVRPAGELAKVLLSLSIPITISSAVMSLTDLIDVALISGGTVLKLTALVEHIMSVTGVEREKVSAFVDQGEILLTGRNIGHGIEVCLFKYDGVISIERYAGDGLFLTALVAAWLQDHDDRRDGLKDPEIDIEINDFETSDVELAVEFEEPIEVVPDESGQLEFDGRRWSVAPVPVCAVERITGMTGRIKP